MIQSANRYLVGHEEFIDLYYAIAEALVAVQRYGRDSIVGPMILEWRDMSERCRNEFGMAHDPVTEDQFRIWLGNQL